MVEYNKFVVYLYIFIVISFTVFRKSDLPASLKEKMFEDCTECWSSHQRPSREQLQISLKTTSVQHAIPIPHQAKQLYQRRHPSDILNYHGGDYKHYLSLWVFNDAFGGKIKQSRYRPGVAQRVPGS